MAAKAKPRQDSGPVIGLEAMKALIMDVPDFPKKGILFKDITPLLADPKGFNSVIDGLIAPFKQKGIEIVEGVESRGVLLAPALAARPGAGIVPLRKKGKLPRKVHSASYDLEYGTDSIGPRGRFPAERPRPPGRRRAGHRRDRRGRDLPDRGPGWEIDRKHLPDRALLP